MNGELIIKKETAENIAEAIREGLNPVTGPRVEFSGSEFVDKIKEGYEYQYSQGFFQGTLKGCRVRTWNVLSQNYLTTISANPSGGGGEYAPDCPYEISLKELLKEDITLNVSYCFTYQKATPDWYGQDESPYFQRLGDWKEPCIKDEYGVVATMESGKITFYLNEYLYNNGRLILYGETAWTEPGLMPFAYIYTGVYVRKESLTKATFINPFISAEEATTLLENSVK